MVIYIICQNFKETNFMTLSFITKVFDIKHINPLQGCTINEFQYIKSQLLSWSKSMKTDVSDFSPLSDFIKQTMK